LSTGIGTGTGSSGSERRAALPPAARVNRMLAAAAVAATLMVAPGIVGTESGLRVMVGVLLLAVTGVLSRLNRLLSGDADRPIPYRTDRPA